MTDELKISGRLVAAARALTGVSQADFAVAAGLPLKTLTQIETGGSAWIESEANVAAIHSGLTYFGVIILDESDGLGAGVRLKFTRQDVRQIVRLENEGGIVGSDDAP